MLYIKFSRVSFICIALLFCFISAKAQEKQVSQLLKELENNPADTTKLRVYDKLALAYSTVDNKKKFYYANKFGQLAKELGIDSSEVNAYLHMGISYGLRDRPDSAIFYFSKAYNKANDNNYKNGMARSLICIGYAYDRSDKKEEAIKKYRQALELYKQIKETDKAGSNKGLISCYLNIGSLYFDIGQYELSISYASQALEQSSKAKDDVGIAKSLFSLGNGYKEINKIQKARTYFQKGLLLAEKKEIPTQVALNIWGLGQLYSKEGNYETALLNFQKALKINRDLKNDYHKNAVLMSIAETYLAMKQPDKAKPYIIESYEDGIRIKSKVVLLKALPILTETYRQKGEFKKALDHQTNYLAIKDSLAYDKTTKSVVFEDFDRVRSENNDLLNDNTKITAKNTSYVKAIVMASILLLFLTLLLVLYYYKNKREKIINALLQSQKDEIASKNAELEQLNKVKNKFFSIVSHDLRSPIATLKMLFELYREGQLNESELSELLAKLEDTIYTTSVFLDNLLEWSKNQLDGIKVNASVFGIEKFVEENLHLMQTAIRLKDLQVETDIKENTVAFADANMINVVVRNLISNAVKFCNAGDTIKIKAYDFENKMILVIKDNGPGISEKDLQKLFNLEHTVSTSNTGEKGHQIGLVLCKDMIEQNNGTITVESKIGEGTTFNIALPKGKINS